MEYTKEQFRQQVKVGIDYLDKNGIGPEKWVTHLTDHLWGTIGMVLQNPVHVGVDEVDEHEGEIPVQ